jgi:pimeloyl-ACP methyl ester carboxylesterase
MKDTKQRSRRWSRWAKLIVLIYCTAGIALYYLQDKLLFHPLAVDRNTHYDFGGQPYEEVNIPVDAGTNLNIIEFKTKNDTTRHGVVLYFHGNAKNISWYAPYAANFTAKGYEVWMMDYPGFGKSTGKLTEQKLYAYALLFYKLARARYKPAAIILYGKSLGTCIAAQLASLRDCKRLILECPYYSMVSLAQHYFPIYPVSAMLHYRLPTYSFLPAITAPLSIFHGTIDGLIPYSQGERLRSLLKPGDEFIPIEGGNHNDLNDFPMFHQKLDSLLER